MHEERRSQFRLSKERPKKVVGVSPRRLSFTKKGKLPCSNSAKEIEQKPFAARGEEPGGEQPGLELRSWREPLDVFAEKGIRKVLLLK